ncbi:T9SS type A sorting domain-containing protein (plasmid) [Hymenobacter sp. NBH84]|uniref:T9SS type A sorting domain-containing protein n=1 Tax=Hymenobacter sp. NBH84 TaxID=2596915 RepID=UPI001624BC6F|nr:T9SS type A sorting domain-containing protein [Hymenobacter sp. NBH84]
MTTRSKFIPTPCGSSSLYTLPTSAQVDFSLYDVSGRKVKTVVRQTQAARQYQYQLTAQEAHLRRPGLYVVVLELDGHRISQKVLR